jgi:hypothetical protein
MRLRHLLSAIVTARRLFLAVLASVGAAGGLILSGVPPLGAAGVCAAFVIVVFGQGFTMSRLARSIDQLFAHSTSLWDSQKSGSARLDRIEARLTELGTAASAPPPHSAPLPAVAPPPAEPPPATMPAPVHAQHPAPYEIAMRMESVLEAAQRAIADSVRDGVRRELLAQQDEAEHRYLLMTDLITAMRSEMAEIWQLLEEKSGAPGKDMNG